MASSNLGQFDTLFNMSVPHILEKIFFPLDYDSFVMCQRVCKTWNSLHSSEPYQTRSKTLLDKKNKNEERLCQFSKDGNVNEVRNLLSFGVNPNCQEADITPLHYAAWKGHKEVAKLLLGAGANLNKSAPFGNTPLYEATIHGHADVVKLLLDEGADPNKANHSGYTLIQAAEMDKTEMVKMLLDAGAEPNIADREGDTPLYLAAMFGNADVVQLLLDWGADPNLATNKGETLLNATLRNMYPNKEVVAKLLTDGGAKPSKRDMQLMQNRGIL